MLARPARGTATREHRQRHAQAIRAELAVKAWCREVRDGQRCRYPWCHATEGLVGAHLTHKGMGGDPQGVRTRPETIITFCRFHHDAFDGRLGAARMFLVIPLSPAMGANWLVEFQILGAARPFAVERAIGRAEPT